MKDAGHHGFFTKDTIAELTLAAGIEEKRVKLQTAAGSATVEITQQ